MGFFLPDRRAQDGIALGMRETQEEEFALCSMTGRNFVMGWVFPRRAEQFRRYLTFRVAIEEEVAEWKSALIGVIRKLSSASFANGGHRTEHSAQVSWRRHYSARRQAGPGARSMRSWY
jgi:hypothetical protein